MCVCWEGRGRRRAADVAAAAAGLLVRLLQWLSNCTGTAVVEAQRRRPQPGRRPYLRRVLQRGNKWRKYQSQQPNQARPADGACPGSKVGMRRHPAHTSSSMLLPCQQNATAALMFAVQACLAALCCCGVPAPVKGVRILGGKVEHPHHSLLHIHRCSSHGARAARVKRTPVREVGAPAGGGRAALRTRNEAAQQGGAALWHGG